MSRRQSLRARAGGEILTLTPTPSGVWAVATAGPAGRGGLVDLRGLTPAEAIGQSVTVWYQVGRLLT